MEKGGEEKGERIILPPFTPILTSSPARTVSPIKMEYVLSTECLASGSDKSANPRLTLNAIFFLIVSVHFGLSIRAPSLNSIPVAKLCDGHMIGT